MDPAALAGLFALLAQAAVPTPLGAAKSAPSAITSSVSVDAPLIERLRAQLAAVGAREAIARVAFAEAGNQGDSGLAAVVYTILNRLKDERWGASVDAVLNAKGQFEPVMRAGGDWRRLPSVSKADQARIDTVLNLALDGRLPDLTLGARYFQNPTIVAARANAGQVPAGLVNFGGRVPAVTIGAHSFYADRSAGTPSRATQHRSPEIFVGPVHVVSVDGSAASKARAGESSPDRSGSTSEPIFVVRIRTGEDDGGL